MAPLVSQRLEQVSLSRWIEEVIWIRRIPEQGRYWGSFEHVQVQHPQYFIHGIFQMQPLLDDGDQHVSRDRNPYLRFHGILARAEEGLDVQVLLDPLEEQLYLPSLLVQCADGEGGQRQVVGQELERLALFRVEIDHATKDIWVAFARHRTAEPDMVIADQSGDRIDRFAGHQLALHVVFGAGDKEGACEVQPIQPGEVDVGFVHDVEGARLDQALLAEQVEHPDIVHLAVADVNETGDCATQVEQRVQLYRCLGGSKWRPCKKRQTQIDRGRIQGIHRRAHERLELRPGGVCGVQRSGNADQVVREIGINLPRPGRIGIRQRVACNRFATKAHVVKPRQLRAQVDFYIAQRFARRQLGECHGKELIQAREILHLVIATMGRYTAAKRSERHIGHDLRKNERALMHGSLPRTSAKSSQSALQLSNRDQTKTLVSATDSLTYSRTFCQRWDTSVS